MKFTEVAKNNEAGRFPIGPYNDPNKKGFAVYKSLVVIQGKCLDKAKVEREFVSTVTSQGVTTSIPVKSGGFAAWKDFKGMWQPDGPRPGNVWTSKDLTFILISDTPGNPANLATPFYVQTVYKVTVKSNSGKALASLVYTATIDMPAPGNVKTNSMDFVSSDPK